MALDQSSAGTSAQERSGRARDIDEAQRLLAAALDLLDKHDLSQPAANVDLAMHQLERSRHG